MKTLKIYFLVILFSTFSFSQGNESGKLELTGNLYSDSKIISNSYPELNRNPMADDLPGKKSAVLSGVLSAILPGSGQVYNEDYWIAGVFVVIEAALITTAVVYDNKGDDQTEYFENYADDYMNPNHNWSVVRYAEWLAEYKGADLDVIIIPGTEGLPPWERVNWAELNAAEREAAKSGGFSHTLPPHGEQQYYELIGKYHSYSSGWNDFEGEENYNLISPNFTYYAGERGEANDYYNTSSTAIMGIYINHVLSAAEAVWGATRFNKNLAVNFRVEPYNTATGTELVPTLKVKFSF